MKLTALEYLVAAVSALNKSIYQPINSAESLDAAVAQKAQFIAYRCQARVVCLTIGQSGFLLFVDLYQTFDFEFTREYHHVLN